jgi:hypothetical protein
MKLSPLLLLILGGCQGTISAPGQPPSSSGGNPPAGGGPTITTTNTAQLCAETKGTLRIGRTLLRRMTRAQLDHTVRDLLGTAATPAAALSPDEKIGPFYNNAIAPITDLIVQQHEEIAAQLAAEAAGRMSQIAPCDLAAEAATSTACATRFIDDLGLRAYRRPLEPAERDEYLALYSMERAQGTAQSAFQLVVETVLESPFFLYHVDMAPGSTPSNVPVKVGSYQLASRLSYFLWDSMPDRQLFDLAATDALQDSAVLAAEVERMLAHPRAADAVPAFHLQWLGIGDMNGVNKDPQRFPQFGATLVADMLAETATFADHVVRRGDGLLSTLFTADFSFPRGGLFGIYGVTQPAGFTPGTQAALNPSERAGLLTQAAFLATHAHPDQTSPVHRGIAVRESLLCQPLGSPPANVNTMPPPLSDTTSTRDRFAAHNADPTCASCHTLIDPIGVLFENYDPIGAYRTREGNTTVDASGEVVGGTGSLAGPLVGAVELGRRLAASRQAGDCLANQWFRYALGRMEANDDACSLQTIHEGFAASGGNVRQLLTKLAQSDAFRHVRATGGNP